MRASVVLLKFNTYFDKCIVFKKFWRKLWLYDIAWITKNNVENESYFPKKQYLKVIRF